MIIPECKGNHIYLSDRIKRFGSRVEIEIEASSRSIPMTYQLVPIIYESSQPDGGEVDVHLVNHLSLCLV